MVGLLHLNKGFPVLGYYYEFVSVTVLTWPLPSLSQLPGSLGAGAPSALLPSPSLTGPQSAECLRSHEHPQRPGNWSRDHVWLCKRTWPCRQGAGSWLPASPSPKPPVSRIQGLSPRAAWLCWETQRPQLSPGGDSGTGTPLGEKNLCVTKRTEKTTRVLEVSPCEVLLKV